MYSSRFKNIAGWKICISTMYEKNGYEMFSQFTEGIIGERAMKAKDAGNIKRQKTETSKGKRRQERI